MKKALVLGGGGSKGAYEIGVWRALNELDMKFDLVTGTSIGALIGVLFVQQEYQKAYDLFDTIQVEDVMANGVNLDLDIELIMSQKGKYVDFLSSYMHHKGADITPFIGILDRLFVADKFFNSPIDYGCMTVNFSKLHAQPMMKKDLTPENTKDYILASASCFPAFPMKVIDDQHFIDGGYHDNVPISLAFEMGADEIVAVDLKSVGKNQLKPPQDNVTYIEPLVPLGSFLLFESDRIHRNMELGYQDAMKKFHKYIGSIYTFALSDKDAIEKVEASLNEMYQQIDTFIHGEKMNVLVEKLVNHESNQDIEKYKCFDYPFLAILERTAFIFEMDDLGVKNFSDFLQNLMNIAHQDVSLLDRNADERISFKEIVEALKQLSAEEIICFIYQFLKIDDGSKVKEIEMLSVVMNESFIMAYALFSLDKIMNSKLVQG